MPTPSTAPTTACVVETCARRQRHTRVSSAGPRGGGAEGEGKRAPAWRRWWRPAPRRSAHGVRSGYEKEGQEAWMERRRRREGTQRPEPKLTHDMPSASTYGSDANQSNWCPDTRRGE
eukprot:2693842-Rhodomonas_salina.3